MPTKPLGGQRDSVSKCAWTTGSGRGGTRDKAIVTGPVLQVPSQGLVRAFAVTDTDRHETGLQVVRWDSVQTAGVTEAALCPLIPGPHPPSLLNQPGRGAGPWLSPPLALQYARPMVTPLSLSHSKPRASHHRRTSRSAVHSETGRAAPHRTLPSHTFTVISSHRL